MTRYQYGKKADHMQHININSSWIIDQNVKAKTIKHLGNIRKYLQGLEVDKTKTMKEKN